jgi:hypothetical protein
MARSRPGIALIDSPINHSIKQHGGGASEDHAQDHKDKNAQRGPAVGCDDQGSESERQGKNRMREADQAQKSRDYICVIIHRNIGRNLFGL